MILSEIAFLAAASIFLAKETDKECYDAQGNQLHGIFYTAFILLIFGHLYQIIKAAYFACSLERKQKESLLKCCL